MSVIKFIILALMLVYLFLVYGNMRWQSPIVIVVNRWISWVMISLLIGYLMHQWDLSDKPLMVLSGTVFLLWFLIESILVWLRIRMLNFSGIPFFPRFSINNGQTPWPTQEKYIELKEFLRSNGFKEEQSIKASILGVISLYSPVYKDLTGKILLQLIFFPQKDGSVAIFYILMSSTEEGSFYITDNLALPVGGYIPKNWIKTRKPLCSSLKHLLAYHQKLIKQAQEDFIPWERTPLDIINHQQSVLEFYNIKEGFLNPTSLHEVQGRLTSEGHYCLWKRSLFLKYLGCCVS